ncbi:MAG: hypothetical protein KF897_12490 [Opitutaceae bacterium]|nr:hypothetical protein [Opitutaceae bacterium]
MTLWRIKDGIPSIADALLVAGGMICGIGIFVPLSDRILDYFEPRGLLVLGYAVLLVIGMGVGGLGFWAFIRNQKKIREEIRIPRLVFAFAAPPLILLFHSILLPVFWRPWENHSTEALDQAWRNLGVSLILVFAWLYVFMVKAAIRYPARTTIIALWFNVGLGAVGVAAKIAALLSKK